MFHVVVVHDPAGVEPEGEVLIDNRAEVARARGVATLPVVPELMKRGAFAGWAKRAYGRGWVFDPRRSSRGCPLMLHVTPEYPVIHWLARVVVDAELGSLGGTLRIASDTAQVGAHATGLMPETSPVSMLHLGPPDAGGGWFVGGRARADIPADMFLAVQLYGTLMGARVQWFAMSQSR